MEYIAKIIMSVFLIVVILVVIYKIVVLLGRFMTGQIENHIDKVNAHIIKEEIEKTQTLLRELDMEPIPVDETRKNDVNFTTSI